MLSLAGGAAVAYLALCALLYTVQDRLLFLPGPGPEVTPADLGWAYAEVALDVGGDRLHGWYLPVPGAETAVLVSHGNAGSIESRLPLAEAFRAMGHAVLLYDYRGYGHSTGRPSEAATYADAAAAYRELRARGHAPGQIVLYGESLGGAVAADLAARVPARLLIVEASFAALPDLAAEVYPWLPARRLTRNRYDSEAKLAQLATPLLVLHSPADSLIPFAHAERLAAAHPGPVGLIATAGDHNDRGFRLRETWRAAVAQAIARPADVARIAAEAGR